LGIVGGPEDRKLNKKTEFPAHSRPMDEPANALMSDAEVPDPNTVKIKRKIGAVSHRKRSIKT